MAHFPKEEYPKFEIEIYPSGWAYSNNYHYFRRLLISPEDRFASGVTTDHYKIINEIPDNISSYHKTSDGMYSLYNGVYRVTFKCAKSWDISKTTAPADQADRFRCGKFSGAGTVTQKNQATITVEDTGYTVSTGYRVLSYSAFQIIQVSGTSNGISLDNNYSAPNHRVNPADPNSQQMYYYMNRVELLEGKTV
jgi:hypothetical protein